MPQSPSSSADYAAYRSEVLPGPYTLRGTSAWVSGWSGGPSGAPALCLKSWDTDRWADSGWMERIRTGEWEEKAAGALNTEQQQTTALSWDVFNESLSGKLVNQWDVFLHLSDFLSFCFERFCLWEFLSGVCVTKDAWWKLISVDHDSSHLMSSEMSSCSL